MVKKINIKALYQGNHHLFECDQREFLDQAAEHFGINIEDVELFAVKKGVQTKITHHDITDLMRIEIIPKISVPKTGLQRTIRSCFENESPHAKSIENIIEKLTKNTTLTGQERKSTIEMLQIYSSTILQKKTEVTPNKPTVSNKKVQVNISYINCKDSVAQTDQVILTPDDNDDPPQEELPNKIKKLMERSDVNSEQVAWLMRESFDDRRNFILVKCPPVVAVRDKYPSLFSLEEVKNEFGRIFHAEKCKEFVKNMYKYAPFIVKKCKSDELRERTKKSMDRSRTDIQKKYAEVVGSVFILTDLMEEQCRFIHLQDYPHGSDDVYPHIDSACHTLKELFFDNLLFQIIVEKQQLCEASNFLEAILCLLASFFIFNIDYPETCRRTMIMFEKLYLGANDTADIDDYTIQMVKWLELEAKNAK